ncbi:transporter [Halosimplex pelagicum]|uniref:Transporter n=1 Tax=Halosimplex pelagicum TaxID=869886 RepID=A0A7D5TBU1_9EURY|nr:transporter [Halosimplex pelagicum]QLH84030.1 transporter [Halosimplex pelagicum]
MTDRPDRDGQTDEPDPTGPDRTDPPAGPAASDSTDPEAVADRIAGTVDDADIDETVARVRSDLDETATRVKTALAEGDPRVVAAGALGFDGLVYAASRYAPEYLGVLGGSPLVVGLFGTVAMATVAVASGFDFGSDGDSVTPILAAVAGLVAWLLAPGLAAATGVPGWVWVVLGVVPLGATAATADGTSVAPTTDPFGVAPRAGDWRGAAAGAAGVAVTVALLGIAGTLGAALGALLALGAVLGLAVAALRAVDDDPAAAVHDDRDAAVEPETLPAPSEAATRPSVRPLFRAIRSAPTTARSLLVGETLVGVAVGLVSVFVVLVVTSVLGLRTTLLGLRLGPSGTFGALVVGELALAAAGDAVGRRAESHRRATAALVGGATLAAAFPLLFVGLPPVTAAVAALFGLFGLRAAAAGARDDAVAEAVDRSAADPDDYRTARALAVAPAPLVGGVLYSLDPTVAFGAATTVGVVGVWELRRFARRTATER